MKYKPQNDRRIVFKWGTPDFPFTEQGYHSVLNTRSYLEQTFSKGFPKKWRLSCLSLSKCKWISTATI